MAAAAAAFDVVVEVALAPSLSASRNIAPRSVLLLLLLSAGAAAARTEGRRVFDVGAFAAAAAAVVAGRDDDDAIAAATVVDIESFLIVYDFIVFFFFLNSSVSRPSIASLRRERSKTDRKACNCTERKRRARGLVCESGTTKGMKSKRRF